MTFVSHASAPERHTTILPVDASKIGQIILKEESDFVLEDWDITLDQTSENVKHLQLAAHQLRDSTIPVAFPTETVYGLGADATRSEAVKGIYKAKQRPSDNPLIVHFASLRQLKDLLRGNATGHVNGELQDPIPAIYKPLIRKFWPGPLTIILPNPTNSVLAPEVTAGLTTFGARMPRNLLALVLLKLANVPIAAPSANASTKPSPTAAEHVQEDLNGRIDYILDGGPCDVGVESTVVDGLSDPPAILRPGGISIEQVRQCEGWEKVVVGYKDASEKGDGAPRAPGMKYRHYSPKARVVLHEAGSKMPDIKSFLQTADSGSSIGIIRTREWPLGLGQTELYALPEDGNGSREAVSSGSSIVIQKENGSVAGSPITNQAILQALATIIPTSRPIARQLSLASSTIWDINLGSATEEIARGLFWALRDLDCRGVDAIFVEGISDGEGDGNDAAVMNRLRKAAAVEIS
ncbi:translation factor [Venturia nashicola]|nr:translation factor [Venturia nashicola]